MYKSEIGLPFISGTVCVRQNESNYTATIFGIIRICLKRLIKNSIDIMTHTILLAYNYFRIRYVIMPTKYCCVSDCRSNSTEDNVSFFSFPKTYGVRWKSVVNREGWHPQKNSKICSKHFLLG